MLLPDYWLHRPPMALTAQTRAEIDQWYARLTAAGPNPAIDYTFPVPKWQFLLPGRPAAWSCMAPATRISVFEPRPSSDLTGSARRPPSTPPATACGPCSPSDRPRYPLTTTNACIRLVDGAGVVGAPRYVFGISRPALRQPPWRAGTVYLLPGETFVNQPSLRFGPYEVRVPQLASLVPVTPLARLAVAPADFPFLNDIRAIDDDRLPEYGRPCRPAPPGQRCAAGVTLTASNISHRLPARIRRALPGASQGSPTCGL
jgi:hypothetical protein